MFYPSGFLQNEKFSIRCSFYPMFPPAVGDNLNLLQMPHIQMDVTPDILILPSRLKSFAKVGG